MNSPKEIFRSHLELLLISAGVMLAGVTIWILVWGVSILATDLGTSLGTPQLGQAAETFDLEVQ